eukprot:c6982_g1_i1.p1 GENE.c6982_g1_i1~~c6982_g1_i1.p1  ORF type:complete len:118 (+),score=37.24 c6982_g1_i1:54-407(+)
MSQTGQWRPTQKERRLIEECNRERNYSMIVRGLVGGVVGFGFARVIQRFRPRQVMAAAGFSVLGVLSGYIGGEISKAQELCRTEGSTLAPILYKNLKARGYTEEQIHRRMGTKFTQK